MFKVLYRILKAATTEACGTIQRECGLSRRRASFTEGITIERTVEIWKKEKFSPRIVRPFEIW